VAATLLYRGESRKQADLDSGVKSKSANRLQATSAGQSKQSDDWSRQRAAIEARLKQTDGLHLVLVRYKGHDNAHRERTYKEHNTHQEWVYNGADIDGSKIVWARETPVEELTQLLNYFANRKVWLVEADLS